MNSSSSSQSSQLPSKQQIKDRSSLFLPLPILYTFSLQLYKTQSFQGLASIQFHLSSTSCLYLDCHFTRIQRLRINDDQVQNPTIQDQEIYLPEKYLRKGKNVLLIEYRGKANSNKEGLIQSMDKNKQPVWVTQFEPFYAQKVFPVFDQPDLKGRMTLILACPGKYHVLSNENEVLATNKLTKGDMEKHVKCRFKEEIWDFLYGYSNGTVWVFPETEVLPVYSFCFAIGDFREIRCKEETRIPISIYSTAEHYTLLQKHSELIFRVTIQGIKFFQQYFRTPFSFRKYDQLFVIGCPTAMQNAGISTFNPMYIQGQQNNHSDTVRLCRIILHQLCHHWFGNVCTMEYWDDIWLNEGITNFMEDYALKSIIPKLNGILQSGIDLNMMYKKNAIIDLQTKQSTHPLRLKHLCCAHMFDGVIYNKGAAITQEFQNMIGIQNFSKFCGEVLTEFRWKNWNTEDFCRVGEKYCPKDIKIKKWVNMFVDTEGVTIVTSEINKNNDTLTVSQIKGIPRYFPTVITLFRSDCTSHTLLHTIHLPISYILIPSLSQYSAVFLNSTNTNYFSQLISQPSLTFFKENLDRITNQNELKTLIYYATIKNDKQWWKEKEFVEKMLMREEGQEELGRKLGKLYGRLREEKGEEKREMIEWVVQRILWLRDGEKDRVKMECLENYGRSFKKIKEEEKE